MEALDVSGTSSTVRRQLEVPLGWTSGAIVSDYDTISKIRARHEMRNRELSMGQPTHSRVGAVREQQVGRQFIPCITRLPLRTGNKE